jgi:hypothetical protein
VALFSDLLSNLQSRLQTCLKRGAAPAVCAACTMLAPSRLACQIGAGSLQRQGGLQLCCCGNQYTHATLHVTASNSMLSPTRAVSQLVAGRLQLHQGDDRGKLLLTRALKTAHHAVSNRQLVSQARPANACCHSSRRANGTCNSNALRVRSLMHHEWLASVDAARHPEVPPRREPQVLNGMAPAQRHGDISGAKDMTVSSYTLARSLGDLPSQIDALQAMDLILIRCDLFAWLFGFLFCVLKVRCRAQCHCMHASCGRAACLAYLWHRQTCLAPRWQACRMLHPLQPHQR